MATTAETILEKKELLAQYQLAEIAILKGQSYTIKDRTLDRANLSAVQKGKKELEQAIYLLEHGGIQVKLGVPRGD